MKVSRLGVGIYRIRVQGRLQAAWLQPRTGFRP